MPKRRANGEGNIRKRKDGRWEGRYTAGYDPETGRYNAKLDTLAAPQFRSRLELTVMNGETAISGTYTYSIETYVANRLSGSTDGNFRALLVAMMQYSDAARAYLGKGN